MIKAISMSRPVQAQEWAMRQASAIVEKHFPEMPLEKQWEISADIAEALTQTRFIFDTDETMGTRNASLETALKAARLVLIETGLFEDSRIIGVIDTALN